MERPVSNGENERGLALTQIAHACGLSTVLASAIGSDGAFLAAAFVVDIGRTSLGPPTSTLGAVVTASSKTGFVECFGRDWGYSFSRQAGVRG